MIELLQKFITDDDRKHYLLEIFKVLFTLDISLEIHTKIFGGVKLIPLTENYFIEVYESFIADLYFIPLTVYIIIWHLFFYVFYLIFMFLYQRWVLKEAFYAIKAVATGIERYNKIPEFVKRIGNHLTNYLLKTLEYFNIVIQDENGNLQPKSNGIAILKELKDEETQISLYYVGQSIVVLIQFALIFFCFIIQKINVPLWVVVTLSIIMLLYFFFLLFIIGSGTVLKTYRGDVSNAMVNESNNESPMMS